jgi:pyruvate kinase
MRRAKIVCTLGPAVAGRDNIRRLVEAGMDVARMNFSHGDHSDHEANFADVRAAAEATGRNVAILLDLQGPKIRIGRFTDGSVELEVGQQFVITTEDVPGDVHQVSTTYQGLPGDVSAGDDILVDDGRLAFKVLSVDGPRVTTEVVVGGKVSNNKGVNLPGVAVSVPALTEKDAEDLRFGLSLGVDIVALSFVRDAVDADGVRAIMDEVGVRGPSSPRWRSPRPSRTCARWSTPSTGSWSRAGTWAWSSRCTRCRWCRSSPSSSPAARPSRSSSPRRCSSR